MLGQFAAFKFSVVRIPAHSIKIKAGCFKEEVFVKNSLVFKG
jgi:hypothetical protein